MAALQHVWGRHTGNGLYVMMLQSLCHPLRAMAQVRCCWRMVLRSHMLVLGASFSVLPRYRLNFFLSNGPTKKLPCSRVNDLLH